MSGEAPSVNRSLEEAWALRNATADALSLAEKHMRQMLEAASPEQIIGVIETFSPARSTGPEWSRSFDPLVERLWAWCTDETMAALLAEFSARGLPWLAIANALSAEHGAELRGRISRKPAWARSFNFTQD